MKKLTYLLLMLLWIVPEYGALLAQDTSIIIREDQYWNQPDGDCWVRPKGDIIVNWNKTTCSELEFDLTHFYYETVEPNGEIDWNSLELLSWHGITPSPEAPILFPIWEIIPIEAPGVQPGELNISIAFLITGMLENGVPMGCLDTLFLPPIQYECDCQESEEVLYADYEYYNVENIEPPGPGCAWEMIVEFIDVTTSSTGEREWEVCYVTFNDDTQSSEVLYCEYFYTPIISLHGYYCNEEFRWFEVCMKVWDCDGNTDVTCHAGEPRPAIGSERSSILKPPLLQKPKELQLELGGNLLAQNQPIDLQLSGMDQKYSPTLQLVDRMGRVWIQEKVTVQQMSIPTEDLAPGFYWLILSDARGKTTTERLLLTH